MLQGLTRIPAWLLVAAPVAAALAMHLSSVARIESALKRTNGVIRSRQDLEPVRQAINHSTGLAIAYLALFGLILLLLITLAASGMAFAKAASILFCFGIITLPMGLLTKRWENELRSLRIESNDSAVEETYRRWLIQWREPRLKLPD